MSLPAQQTSPACEAKAAGKDVEDEEEEEEGRRGDEDKTKYERCGWRLCNKARGKDKNKRKAKNVKYRNVKQKELSSSSEVARPNTGIQLL